MKRTCPPMTASASPANSNSFRAIEVGHVPSCVARRFNYVERIEDDVAVAHIVLSADGPWSGFTNQSLCENEHAPFRNQIADPASNTRRACRARKECLVGGMIVDRRTTDLHAQPELPPHDRCANG